MDLKRVLSVFGAVVFGSVFDAFSIIFSKIPKIYNTLQKPISKIWHECLQCTVVMLRIREYGTVTKIYLEKKFLKIKTVL